MKLSHYFLGSFISLLVSHFALTFTNAIKLNSTSVRPDKPGLTSKYIQTEDIREVIYMGLTGLYLYDYISSGRYCVESLDTYVTDLEMMTDALIDAFGYDPTNRALYEYGLFNFTNSLGRFSPILRRCYTIGGEID
jgi:hypothetical protein